MSVIESVLPPRVIDFIQRMRGAPGFFGDFDSFESARAASAGYDTAAEADAATRSEVLRWPFVTDREQQTLSAFAPLLNGPLRVLDVGGANAHYFRMVRQLTKHPMSCVVVETPEVVKRCRGQYGVTFVSEAPDELFDVAHLSGILQYLPDPYAALSQYMTKARWTIINRLPLSERDRITVQRTPSGSCPAWFFGREKFIALITGGASIRMQWDVPQDCPLLDGKRVTYCGMLLERR